MIVTILAGLVRDSLDQFAVYFHLIVFPVILDILAAETPAVRHVTPISGFFGRIQEKRFFLGLDGLIGVPLKMDHQQREGGFVHVQPALEAGIKVTTGTVVMIFSGTRGFPFIDRRLHFMANDTGFILPIAN